MTVENLPIIYVIIMAFGMGIVLIGILRLAHLGDELESKPKNEPELSDIFHYFLQEEERKNNDMRAMLMQDNKDNKRESRLDYEYTDYDYTIEERIVTPKKDYKREQEVEEVVEIQNKDYINMIERYQRGETIDSIAKTLGKGVGEVKLVISLYVAEGQ